VLGHDAAVMSETLEQLKRDLDGLLTCGAPDARMVEHFAMLDTEEPDTTPIKRFVLMTDGAYSGSWGTVDHAQRALAPGQVLYDTKTGVYWTSRGIYR
jgi:hypothetical protein